MASREEKQLTFINSHYHEIIKKAVENKDQEGYVPIYATEDFQLQKGSPSFFQGEFDKANFIFRGSPEAPEHIEVEDVFFVYYKVLWSDNKTLWEVKEVVIQPELY